VRRSEGRERNESVVASGCSPWRDETEKKKTDEEGRKVRDTFFLIAFCLLLCASFFPCLFIGRLLVVG